MALINNIIQKQEFEVVLQKIASILFLEISQQITLQSLTDQFELYVERSYPYDNSEDVMVNVSCESINYSDKNQKDVQGLTNYYIDVYTRGIETDALDGDFNTRNKLHKYIGFIRYILSYTGYKTLDTGFGVVGGVYVNSINFDNNDSNNEASFVRMARLSLSVRIYENQSLESGVELTGSDTITKLSQTDKGFKLTLNT